LVDVGGETIVLLPDEVEVRIDPRAGFAAASDGPYLAALQTDLTPELVREGLAREVVRRIQELRRELDLHLAQRIEIVYQASSELTQALAQHRAVVVGEVLADRFEPGTLAGQDGVREFAFDGETLRLRLAPVGDPIG
jgi:isoleucyl-tRNA synthetase